MELMQAHEQWANRSDDERFMTLEGLHAATLTRAHRCEAHVFSHAQLKVHGDLKVYDAHSRPRRELQVSVPGMRQRVDTTHWSFGQLCTRAQVPAKFARGGCHPGIVARALNWNLQHVAPVEDSNVMVEVRDGGEVVIRALTSPSYGRIYDHRVVESVMNVNEDERWVIPAGSTMTQEEAAKNKRATTLYASDRDVFIFLVDPNTPIEVHNPRGPDACLFRGFVVWNSEVGAATMGIRTFLYNHVCDNRIVWGAQNVRTLKVRHTSGGPDRFEYEAAPMLSRYANASPADTVATVKKAMELQVGDDDEEVAKWLRTRNFTKAESAKLIEKAKEEEGEARTVWQLVQGGTASARAIQHTDARTAAERRVSGLLAVAEAAA